MGPQRRPTLLFEVTVDIILWKSDSAQNEVSWFWTSLVPDREKKTTIKNIFYFEFGVFLLSGLTILNMLQHIWYDRDFIISWRNEKKRKWNKHDTWKGAAKMKMFAKARCSWGIRFLRVEVQQPRTQLHIQSKGILMLKKQTINGAVSLPCSAPVL